MEMRPRIFHRRDTQPGFQARLSAAETDPRQESGHPKVFLLAFACSGK